MLDPEGVTSDSRGRRKRMSAPPPAILRIPPRGLKSRLVGRAHGLLALVDDDARVYGLARAGDDLEVHLVAGDFEDHERHVLVERLRGQGRVVVHVAVAQLAARARDEIVDAFLRLDALVEVLVAGEDYVDAVLQKDRLDDLAQRSVGAVLAARRVRRVVKEGYLPLGGVLR